MLCAGASTLLAREPLSCYMCLNVLGYWCTCFKCCFPGGGGVYFVHMAAHNCVFLNWNVRGLNNPVRRRVVCDLVSHTKAHNGGITRD
jgi:hypothetical protein